MWTEWTSCAVDLYIIIYYAHNRIITLGMMHRYYIIYYYSVGIVNESRLEFGERNIMSV